MIAVGLALAGAGGRIRGGAVTGGGSLSGQVKFAGAAPAPEKFEVTKDQEACGKEKTKPDLIVGSGGGIANAVVVVKATKGRRSPVPTEPVTFDQKGCEYTRTSSRSRPAARFACSTPTASSTTSTCIGKVNPEANRAMPKFQKQVDWKVEKPEWPIAVKCDAHPWMHAYWLRWTSRTTRSPTPTGTSRSPTSRPATTRSRSGTRRSGRPPQKVTIQGGQDTKVAWEMKKG